MIFKNSSSPYSDNQEIKTKSVNFSYKENFKSEQKSFLNDSEFIENYNNALKSPQSRRLYKTLENDIHSESIKAQEILPLDKFSILDSDGTIAIEWGAYGVPETFLIQKKKIIKKIIGPIDKVSFLEIKEMIQ